MDAAPTAARRRATTTLSLAVVVDALTRAQLRRQLGAVPMWYALLEVLQVREIINRYCPSEAQVDQGTVAMVLILNRLMAPRPLVHVADGVAQTVLTQTLGVSADKFNDDRLGRLLDALAAHPRDIWLEIVNVALVQFDKGGEHYSERKTLGRPFSGLRTAVRGRLPDRPLPAGIGTVSRGAGCVSARACVRNR